MKFNFKNILNNNHFKSFSIVTILDFCLIFFNYLFVTTLTNWLSSDDYSNFSYFSSLSAVFFTIISFGSANFIYRYINKGSLNIINLNSHIHSKLIIALFSFIFLLILTKLNFLESYLIIIALFSGLLISFNLGPFYDILSKTYKFSLIKLFSWIFAYGLIVILYLVNNDISLNEVICGVIFFNFVFFIFSYFNLKKNISQTKSRIFSIKNIFNKSKIFALTSVISVIVDYVILFTFKNNTESNIIASIFILIKLSVGIKTLDSSLQKVLINKYKEKSTTSFFYKIALVRISILGLITLLLLLFNDSLSYLIENSIFSEIQNLFPIWIIYMLSYVLNHFGTRLYIKGSKVIYLNINIIKFMLVMFLWYYNSFISNIDLKYFILSISIINISEGIIFIYYSRKL